MQSGGPAGGFEHKFRNRRFSWTVLRAVSYLTLFATLAVAAEAPNRALLGTAKQSLIAGYGRLPLSFEANQEQVNPKVKFISRGGGYTLFLTSTEAVLGLRKGSPRPGVRLPLDGADQTTASVKSVVLQMNLLGANDKASVSGVDELPGKINYFIGRNPAKWHTNVPTYSKVKYPGIYPGVDLIYYGSQGQLEYDFVLSPWADPNSIAIEFDGAPIEIDSAGNLALHTDGGEVRFRRPVAYQLALKDGRGESGDKRIIGSRFVLRGNNKVAFEVAPYDHSQPLVIDPVLVYSTYLGGSFPDEPLSVAVDSSGSAYVTGITCSADFPVTQRCIPDQPQRCGRRLSHEPELV